MPEEHVYDFVPILNGTVLWCKVDGNNARKDVDESYYAGIEQGMPDPWTD